MFQVLTWDVGKITPQKLPGLKGMVNLQSGAPKPEENPSLNIQFKIQQMAISGENNSLHGWGRPRDFCRMFFMSWITVLSPAG